MQININAPTTTVRFDSLNSGDVFRYDIDDVDHYIMKVEPDEILNNCIDLTNNTLGRMNEYEEVYKVQSAKLTIVN